MSQGLRDTGATSCVHTQAGEGVLDVAEEGQSPCVKCGDLQRIPNPHAGISPLNSWVCSAATPVSCHAESQSMG